MPKDLAIVLNSGSVNSVVVSALAQQRHRLVMLHIDPLPAPARARAAYDQQVAHFKPYREHTVPLPLLSSNRLAARVDPRLANDVTPRLLRLLPMMGVAAVLAAHHQATAIYLGLRLGAEADQLVRGVEWTQVWAEMLQTVCGKNDLEILTPLLELDRWQVVDLGYRIAAPLEKTWTCEEASAAEPCGRCTRCRDRDAAFIRAAKSDPAESSNRR